MASAMSVSAAVTLLAGCSGSSGAKDVTLRQEVTYQHAAFEVLGWQNTGANGETVIFRERATSDGVPCLGATDGYFLIGGSHFDSDVSQPMTCSTLNAGETATGYFGAGRLLPQGVQCYFVLSPGGHPTLRFPLDPNSSGSGQARL